MAPLIDLANPRAGSTAKVTGVGLVSLSGPSLAVSGSEPLTEVSLVVFVSSRALSASAVVLLL